MKKYLLLLLLSTPCYGGSVYIDQVGDNNSVYVVQSTSGNGEAILLNQGNGNTQSIIQDGSGDHIAFIGTPPVSQNANGTYVTNTSAYNNNNNTLSINQNGSGNHTAAINLDPSVSNQNNTASITQDGGGDKNFTLALSGSNIGATVVQDNATTPDSSSMSIQCYTGTCSGYSYTKH